MSYILDALKKLEQKHQQEGAPNLLTVQRDVSPIRKKRIPWPYIVVGIVLLNGIFIIMMFSIGPWKSVAQPPPSQIQVARDNIAPSQISSLPANNNETTIETKKDSYLGEQKADALPEPSKPPTPAPAQPKTPLPKPVTATSNVPAKTQDETTPRSTKPVPQSNKVVNLKELPADVKSKLTELKMTVHSYNEQPQSRFAVINNMTVREGQAINGELKLERITQNGVVLTFQGHKFTLGINESP